MTETKQNKNNPQIINLKAKQTLSHRQESNSHTDWNKRVTVDTMNYQQNTQSSVLRNFLCTSSPFPHDWFYSYTLNAGLVLYKHWE